MLNGKNNIELGHIKITGVFRKGLNLIGSTHLKLSFSNKLRILSTILKSTLHMN